MCFTLKALKCVSLVNGDDLCGAAAGSRTPFRHQRVVAAGDDLQGGTVDELVDVRTGIGCVGEKNKSK